MKNNVEALVLLVNAVKKDAELVSVHGTDFSQLSVDEANAYLYGILSAGIKSPSSAKNFELEMAATKIFLENADDTQRAAMRQASLAAIQKVHELVEGMRPEETERAALQLLMLFVSWLNCMGRLKKEFIIAKLKPEGKQGTMGREAQPPPCKSGVNVGEDFEVIG
ncbi:hypothetical protein D9611_008003 [Ephemerocybe angulata]|uniref:Uncharacterized protein n=1 Tax=Ephemerocybe angulata TaxID=980116 RepID=A0A8H5BZB3_9AGAR|nr:hypothetical protein D9611_008003 [Tulosesus angulatus]